MFKRFHDRQTNSKSQNTAKETTYAQIRKDLTARKVNYAERHQKQKQEPIEETLSLTLECHKTSHYLFQGVVRGKTKVGEGALMLKNGTIIFGAWDNGWLEGRALIFTPFRGRILANFSNGKLSGWSIAFYGTQIIRCTLFYENQIDGEKLTFNEKEQMWVASRCSPQGKILSIIHAEKGTKSQLPSFIQSEELKDMFTRFAVMRESFLDTEILGQFEIGLTTSYIGFVDEEKRPCGLGCAYSDQEIYCGNFFEGVLEHYGRMMFENGDIYQGEMLAGSFWGTGMYYTPTANETSIIVSDEKEQRVESQFIGYVMIDITPSIGAFKEQGESGIKGDALRKNIQGLQPYYLKEFTNYKRTKVITKSQASEYGHSQDMNVVVKEGKEVYSRKDPNSIIKDDLQLPSPSFKPKQTSKNERWLNFQPTELKDIGLKKTMSLDKRDAAALKKTQGKNKAKPINLGHDDQSLDDVPNYLPRNSPKGSPKAGGGGKYMMEIPFGKQLTLQPEVRPESEAVHNHTLPLNSVPVGGRGLDFDVSQKIEEQQLSEHSSYVSGDEKKLAALFDRGKNTRKKIFF